MREDRTVFLLVLLLHCVVAVCGCGGGPIMGPPPPPGCMNASATVICTQSGQVQGTIESNIRAFRGIPYAAPPVGNLRWRPTAASPNWQGVRSATSFGNRCPQTDFNNGVQGDEDCLTLNIYTTNPPPNSQPVMVFFHGGGEILGDAQTPPYDVPPPLATHGVIVVTVQYRIGLLGFFAHPLLTAEGGGSSGNYGLMDMIASLRWVRDNIAEFGGDPSRVMIFGESAGSANVEVLLAAPPAQGLFSRAGMESSAYTGGLLTGGLAGAYPLYTQLVPLVGCNTAPDVLACLRAVPAATIVLTEPQFPGIGWNIEPIVMPVDPFDKLQQQGSPVPLLIGSNREEATGLGDDPTAPLDPSGYAAAIHAQFDPILAGAGAQVLALYPYQAYDTPRYAHIAVQSDFMITCPTRVLARAVAGAQNPAVWRYFFTHTYDGLDPSGTLKPLRASTLTPWASS
jgi:para-nitrobenzyl esterase